MTPAIEALQEVNGYVVLMPDKASSPTGFWYVGAYLSREVADDVAAKQGAWCKVRPFVFAGTHADALAEEARDGARYRLLRDLGAEFDQLPVLDARGTLVGEFLDRELDVLLDAAIGAGGGA